MRMRRGSLVFPTLVLLVLSTGLLAQGGFQIMTTGKAFDDSIVNNFYLEGQAIPAQKRNATLVKGPSGKRTLFALLDTSGYGTDITQKYVGMFITEGELRLCGKELQVGSYGFGIKGATEQASSPKTLHVYDQAGQKVTECGATHDAELKQPRPLQVIAGKDATARLYLGRDWVELK